MKYRLFFLMFLIIFNSIVLAENGDKEQTEDKNPQEMSVNRLGELEGKDLDSMSLNGLVAINSKDYPWCPLDEDYVLMPCSMSYRKQLTAFLYQQGLGLGVHALSCLDVLSQKLIMGECAANSVEGSYYESSMVEYISAFNAYAQEKYQRRSLREVDRETEKRLISSYSILNCCHQECIDSFCESQHISSSDCEVPIRLICAGGEYILRYPVILSGSKELVSIAYVIKCRLGHKLVAWVELDEGDKERVRAAYKEVLCWAGEHTPAWLRDFGPASCAQIW